MRIVNRMIGGVVLLAASCLAYKAGDMIHVRSDNRLIAGTYEFKHDIVKSSDGFYQDAGQGAGKHTSPVRIMFENKQWTFMTNPLRKGAQGQSETLLISKKANRDEIPRNRQQWYGHNDNFKHQKWSEHRPVNRKVNDTAIYGGAAKVPEDFEITELKEVSVPRTPRMPQTPKTPKDYRKMIPTLDEIANEADITSVMERLLQRRIKESETFSGFSPSVGDVHSEKCGSETRTQDDERSADDEDDKRSLKSARQKLAGKRRLEAALAQTKQVTDTDWEITNDYLGKPSNWKPGQSPQERAALSNVNSAFNHGKTLPVVKTAPAKANFGTEEPSDLEALEVVVVDSPYED